MRYIARLQDHKGRWSDVLYTDNAGRAARLVRVAVASNPKVKSGRVVDTQEQIERRQER